jgi:hypothetical protein
MTNTELSTADQVDWNAIFEQSGYRIASLAEIAKIDEGSFRKYLHCDRIPREANRKKMEHAMKLASELPRLKYHPSYGYATPEQIERLKTMKVGADMDALLKRIEEQTRNKGKFK